VLGARVRQRLRARRPRPRTRPIPSPSMTNRREPRGNGCGGSGRTSAAASMSPTPCFAPAELKCGFSPSSPSLLSSGRYSSISTEVEAIRLERRHASKKPPPELSSPGPCLAGDQPFWRAWRPCARLMLQSAHSGLKTGVAAAASLPRLDDAMASPAARRIAATATTLVTRPTRVLQQAP
jgi:hypothetical protein